MKKTLLISAMGVILFGFTGTGSAYTGRLKCETLSDMTRVFPALEIQSYCDAAVQACRIKDLYEKADPRQPLSKILNGRLQQKVTLALEICELAFMTNEADYYERHLKRPLPKKEAPAEAAS